MPNITHLEILAFGTADDLSEFDRFPPFITESEIQITHKEGYRKLHLEINSNITDIVLQAMIDQMPRMALLIGFEAEPAYCALLYKEKCRRKMKLLFEISDYRDDEFFNNFTDEYFQNFDQIHLTPEIIEIIQETTVGKTYLNLLINPGCYINI